MAQADERKKVVLLFALRQNKKLYFFMLVCYTKIKRMEKLKY